MNKLIKTAAALSIIATFGVANAQQEERTQMQKPSSGQQPAMAKPTMPKASGPKVDDTVKQTQKPSSGTQPTTGKPSAADTKVDETVKQTQKPGDVPMTPDARKMGTKP